MSPRYHFQYLYNDETSSLTILYIYIQCSCHFWGAISLSTLIITNVGERLLQLASSSTLFKLHLLIITNGSEISSFHILG